MIARYARQAKPMAALFTDEAQWASALTVELAAVAARAALGDISYDEAQIILERAPKITPAIVAEIEEREETTDHDVAAFVDVIQKHIGDEAARWFHFGMTSADVVDTSLGLRLHQASGLLIEVGEGLLRTLCDLAREHADTACAGRTHGQHAEVITFGVRITGWVLKVHRALKNLRAARDEMAVGKLSGACGTYTNIDPAVERQVCDALGLTPITATQVIPRDLHAELMSAVVRLTNAIGDIAFNLRMMALTEVREVEEGRRAGQKGSSAMPHKHNPIRCEQLCGLARTMRGYLAGAEEQTELLFERDISHSGPERIVFPDAFVLAYYMTVTMDRVLRNLVVHKERMQLNIYRARGLMYSQTVLTALIETSGMQRDDAYRLVQSLSEIATDESTQLRTLLERSPEVTLTKEQLDHIFDQDRLLVHVPTIIARLPA